MIFDSGKLLCRINEEMQIAYPKYSEWRKNKADEGTLIYLSLIHIYRLKQLEDITNGFKGVDKSFAIQAGREIRVMVVPDQVSDADMVLLARDISKQIEAELEYPGQIKVNVIRESRVTDYAK